MGRICILGYVLFCLLPAAYAAPRIALSPKEIDLGRVAQESTIERTVTVRNEGDAPLVLDEVVTSCPCASLELPPEPERTLAPGQARQLTLRYAPDDREGQSAATLVVYSNDPENPVAMVEVTVFVVVPLQIRPTGGVTWGMAPRGIELEKELTLIPGVPEDDIALLDIAVDQAGVALRQEKIEKDGERFIRIWFTLGRDVPLGPLKTTIRAKVAAGDAVLDVAIPMAGMVLGDLLLTPPAIISPKTAYGPGQRISQITVQSSTGGPPPDILGVMAEGPLRAVIAAGDDPAKHVIAVHAADNAPPGPQAGRLFVMTSSMDEPIVAVPVYWRMGSPVALKPDHLVFDAGDDAKRIEIRQQATHKVSVRDVRFESDVIDVAVETADQSGEDRPAVLVVRVPEQRNPEKRSTLIVVETDQAGNEKLVIPVLIRDE